MLLNSLSNKLLSSHPPLKVICADGQQAPSLGTHEYTRARVLPGSPPAPLHWAHPSILHWQLWTWPPALQPPSSLRVGWAGYEGCAP